MPIYTQMSQKVVIRVRESESVTTLFYTIVILNHRARHEKAVYEGVL